VPEPRQVLLSHLCCDVCSDAANRNKLVLWLSELAIGVSRYQIIPAGLKTTLLVNWFRLLQVLELKVLPFHKASSSRRNVG
jgi:hypothetical protein